ncbi:MAG: ATP-binding protein [Myxococcota bacterium]
MVARDDLREFELRRLRFAYIVALGVIGGLTIAGQLLVQVGFQGQLKSAEIINLAGRQRMLSQRLTKQALLVTSGHAEPSSLSTDLDEWSRAHEALTRGELDDFSDAASEDEGRRLDQAKLRLEDVLIGFRDSGHGPNRVASLLSAERTYLPLMDRRVFAYSNRVDASMARLRFTEIGLGILTLLVLVLELVLIFNPLFRRLQAAIRALRDAFFDLSASDARYERAAFGSESGLWEFDWSSSELYLSPRFRALAGLPAEGTLSWSDFEKRVVEKDRPAFQGAFREPRSIALDLRVRGAGRVRWLRLKGRARENESVVAGCLSDIDARRRLQAELERVLGDQESELRQFKEDLERSEMLHAVGGLAAGVAHDFNNCLQIIRSASDSLIEDREPNPDDLQSIRKACESASEQVRKLMSLRPGWRGQGTETSFSIHQVLEAVEVLARRLLPASVRLEVKTPGSLPSLWGVQGELEQAVLNLVINARDAMPEGGTVGLFASASVLGGRPGIELQVRDEGEGMDEVTQRRAFEPFYTTKGAQGSGLGLAMVGTIIKRHGGVLSVSSQLGQGTEIRIWLPPGSTRMSGMEGTRGQAALPRGLKVLVVDDDERARNLLERMLSTAGLEVESVATGREALTLLRKPNPGFDAFICDVMLQDMLGTDIPERLPAPIPCVFVSSFVTSAAVAGVDEGVSFVKKPFESDALFSALASAVLSKSATTQAPTP